MRERCTGARMGCVAEVSYSSQDSTPVSSGTCGTTKQSLIELIVVIVETQNTSVLTGS